MTMKIRGLNYALNVGAIAALLAGCGGSQPPVAASPMLTQRLVNREAKSAGQSWMKPDAVTRDLLYISDFRTVKVFTYPQGQPEGILRGFGDSVGECADNKANVFVVDRGANEILEYAHGAITKRAVLHSLINYPNGCSVDPTTGNLAVATRGYSSRGAALEVYRHARGTATLYRDSRFQHFDFCGYDSHGNLFADGETSSRAFVFAELAKGTKALKNVTLNQTILFPGQVQWDGANVAVGDAISPEIYEFTISGSSGDKVGTTHLGDNAYHPQQFWIQRPTVIVPNLYEVRHSFHSNVLFYNYPAGGRATKRLFEDLGLYAYGAVVSLAPH